MSALFADTALSCRHKIDPDTTFSCQGWPTFTLLLFVPEYIHTTCQKPLLYIRSLVYNMIEQWQQQHTTTNMSRAALPSTSFSPLPPWFGQRHRQLMVPPLHIGYRLAQGAIFSQPLTRLYIIFKSALVQPSRRVSRGWGCLKHKSCAARPATGSTMVVLLNF
jgi:hypothetical protein